MLNNYQRSADKLMNSLRSQGIQDEEVLNVMHNTPRHVFIDDVLKHKSYENTALPIGQGQTISQPYIVAKMTEVLRQIGIKDNILEVGTGSGYQTAILAQLFDKVFSIERIKALQWQAKRRLHQLDLYNVSMKHGDGWQGWQSKGPFNGIIVTAAAATVPESLLLQLAEGGAMIIPIGVEEQVLTLFIHRNGQITQQPIASVKFVPLVAGPII
ncbi:protein-L-isoaspartate(D-aspartate) O-methyltransferase [Pseudoalteromonas luteoviolacea]|uniref:Protein-L-isoaspartate O-methyltransferase n=1 Tax=Pseudoalteromonas luteoviolacea S4054 TaxID=1129367 RepID=A0A0F6AIL1_9GAMM|nr:protein-L-isoaspartate(D-aspartate) O-methyltransferase [Pseudoalteromonas luteoviolacea]AOT07157.1 protein-L-isoaspartate O-methyltransferase [Pseudoalteromonas luteoviolacea]AOT12074.1 protein-L-isoaspartate O-methyltransferase [Pseudoalteromonas luteoviolacea]AOT16987.1 protein-L-isoaspartate O-methyltransferase [Pseudoalteromonas luteoviolacea]KKE85424.1 protein-L-isoaspartate O-methyltransferase [Pseudoalteromonas luteoviolacea S4054]KZN73772.1 protein-L-isoaspartate O-methyltransferas